jgi:MFS family permease
MIERSVSAGRVFALCFAAGLCEGYDMLVAGVAAPRFAPVLGLGPQQIGGVFGAAGLGLLLGALIGGRMADLVGRRPVLVISLLVLGVFSIASAFAGDLPSLLAMRFLAGLGLGGALPNLLALVNETSPPDRAATRVTMLGSAMPFGGACLGMLMVVMPGLTWQAMFWIGGIAPIVVAVACQLLLPRFPAGRPDRTRGSIAVGYALGGERRALRTALLWITTLCVAISVAMLVNWLPSLMISRDFAGPSTARIVMMLTLGGAASGFVRLPFAPVAGGGGVSDRLDRDGRERAADARGGPVRSDCGCGLVRPGLLPERRPVPALRRRHRSLSARGPRHRHGLRGGGRAVRRGARPVARGRAARLERECRLCDPGAAAAGPAVAGHGLALVEERTASRKSAGTDAFLAQHPAHRRFRRWRALRQSR